MLNKNGFSIVEATISAVIFTTATAGILSMVASAQKPVGVSEREIEATYAGQQVLENLRNNVDQRDWDAGNLSLGQHQIFSGIYNAIYDVTDVPGSGGVRKASLTVSWDEL